MNLRLHRLSVICQSALEKVARPAGFEPATFGSGGQRSIQLSYGRITRAFCPRCRENVARPEGFEPPTYGFEARRSIQLSYGRVLQSQSMIIHRS